MQAVFRDRLASLWHLLAAIFVAIALSVPNIPTFRVGKRFASWFWSWSATWPWDILWGIVYAILVASEEFVGALIALSLVGIGGTSRLAHWSPKSSDGRIVRSVALYLGIPILFCGFVLVTLAAKADKPWSKIPAYLASYIPVPAFDNVGCQGCFEHQQIPKQVNISKTDPSVLATADQDAEEYQKDQRLARVTPSVVRILRVRWLSREPGENVKVAMEFQNDGPNDVQWRLGSFVGLFDDFKEENRRQKEEIAWKTFMDGFNRKGLNNIPIIDLPANTPLNSVLLGPMLDAQEASRFDNNDTTMVLFVVGLRFVYDVNGVTKKEFCFELTGDGNYSLCAHHNH